MVTPCSTALRACPVPGSSAVVSIHSGCSQPASRQPLVTWARTASRLSNLVGLTMTAACLAGSRVACSAPSGRKWSRCGRRRPKRRGDPPVSASAVRHGAAISNASSRTSTIAPTATQPA